MSYIFKMPKAGEGITEGEIVKWTVAVGDSVKEDATLVEIQNDKLVSEVPSPVTGTIIKLLVEEGTVAQVGDPLAEIDAPGYESSEVPPAVKVEEVSEKTVETPKVETASASNYIFNLPKAGEGITEGEIVKWAVSVGDKISADQTLLEVQNDKLVQEVPSPVTGVIHKLLVEEGVVASVGQPIAEIVLEGQTAVKSSEAKQVVIVESQKPEAKVTKTSTKSSNVGGILLAMPSVRQLARDKGIDLSEVSGSGKHGHITKLDVENFSSAPEKAVVKDILVETHIPKKAETASKSTPQVIVESSDTTRESMSAVRRAISSAMVKSKAHAPHVTIFDEVEVSKLMDHRSKFKDVAAEQDIKLTYLAYMTKAVVSVLRKYPILNASVDESTNEIVYKNYYNIGIAVDTEHGLYVPNVKGADRKGIFTVASDITQLAQKTHNRELTTPEMTNGSTTISNIGSAWGMWFTPIINFPEVAIFGMGRIEKKPVILEDGTVGVGQVLYLSMSFDHRIIDGSVAQLAMNELKRLMADPEILMMEG